MLCNFIYLFFVFGFGRYLEVLGDLRISPSAILAPCDLRSSQPSLATPLDVANERTKSVAGEFLSSTDDVHRN